MAANKPVRHGPDHMPGTYDALPGSPNDTEYFIAASIIPVAADGSSLLDWQHDAGGTLVDLTDTSRPAVLLSARYCVMVNAIAQVSAAGSEWDVNGYWQMVVNIDSGPTTYVAEPIGTPTYHGNLSDGIPICLTAILWMNAGDEIRVTASNRDSHGHSFNMFGPAITILP